METVVDIVLLIFACGFAVREFVEAYCTFDKYKAEKKEREMM